MHHHNAESRMPISRLRSWRLRYRSTQPAEVSVKPPYSNTSQTLRFLFNKIGAAAYAPAAARAAVPVGKIRFNIGGGTTYLGASGSLDRNSQNFSRFIKRGAFSRCMDQRLFTRCGHQTRLLANLPVLVNPQFVLRCTQDTND